MLSKIAMIKFKITCQIKLELGEIKPAKLKKIGAIYHDLKYLKK